MGIRFEWLAIAPVLLALGSAGCTVSVTTDDAKIGGDEPVGGDDPGSSGEPEYPDITLAAGTPMARVELELPSASNFVLRATIPVPPGVWSTGDTTIPAAVVDYDGTVVPAQVETVARYADDSKGADVIEVLARVRRDPALAAGARTTYEIQYAPHSAPAGPGTPGVEDLHSGPTSIPSNLESLLQDASSIRIATTDVFGHKYETRPLAGANAKLLRYGSVMTQLRTYDVMEPLSDVAGNTGTLPHFFGVHSYMSVQENEDILLLDLRLNNGPDGNDTGTDVDDPMAKVYFENVQVWVPAGWVLLQDGVDPFMKGPFASSGGSNYAIVAKPNGGRMHVMGQQGQFHRRLAIAPAAKAARAQEMLDLAGLAFVKEATEGSDELLSWNYAGVARYFPQAHSLPTLDHMGLAAVRATLKAEFQAIRGHIENGTSTGAAVPIVATNYGWSHPYGIAYGGMTGGSGINLYQGVRTAAARSAEGLHQLMDVHRMQSDRQQVTLYHKDGQPAQVKHWIENGTDYTYVPIWYFNGKMNTGDDVFGFDVSPQFQRDYVAANTLEPNYEAALLGYQAHDTQHLVRYTRSAKALAWLANDAIAKDDLLMTAENFRFEFHEHYNTFYKHVQSTGLLSAQLAVAANPGKGFEIGRGQGWGIDVNNAAMALSRDSTWRAETRAWMVLIAETINDGQADCSGIIQSQVISHLFSSKYRARQSIEGAILENAIRGMRKRAFEGVDTLHTAMVDDILHDSYYGMISGMAWDPTNSAPFSHLAVGPLNQGDTPYCVSGDVPSDGLDAYLDGFQIWSSMAYAYEMTSNPLFQTYAAKLTGSGDIRADLEAAGVSNIGNRAALLALAQEGF